MLLYNDYQPKWIRLWDESGVCKLSDEVVGFNKKNQEKYHMGGCYLYAYDPEHKIAGEEVDYLDERVVYIGTAGSSKYRGIRSRTADFMGTITRAAQLKSPYTNGTLFRIKYGEENKENLYVAYYPMGYGEEIKIPAHGLETRLHKEYVAKYGGLPTCDGPICTQDRIMEMFKQLSKSEQKNILKKLEKK